MFSAARAEYICPMQPVSDCHQPEQHLAVYMKAVRASGSSSTSVAASDFLRGATAMGRDSRFQTLASTVFLLIAAIFDTRNGQWYSAVHNACRVSEVLAGLAGERACSRQLEQLRREQQLPQLTVQQLRYLAHQLAVAVGSKLLAAHHHPDAALLLDNTEWPPLTLAQVASLMAACVSSTVAMLQLEPQNPKSVCVAASCLWSPIKVQQAVDLHLSLYSLAQQQGSDWWMVRGAQAALSLAGHCPAQEESAAAAWRRH